MVDRSQIGQEIRLNRRSTLTPFVSAAFGTSEDLGGSPGIAIAYDFAANIGVEGEVTHLFDGVREGAYGCLGVRKGA